MTQAGVDGEDDSLNLVFLGPPGAGKGTQAALLSERCEVPKYATGDILREAVKMGTELGREAKDYMNRGELVPDEVVLGIVRDALRSPAAGHGFILDGFPRTVAQAEGLKGILDEQERKLGPVLYFDVDEEELVRRLAGRRVCPDCGAVYNVHSDAPAVNGECDRCGGELEIREDDREETVRNRLRVYREKTEPLLSWYRRSSVPLREINASGTVDEVYQRLLEAVGCP